MRTRFAPTPSGYLHLGNAVNARVVELLARKYGAQLALRIDDLDPVRFRPEYLDDVFDMLTWLGIEWTVGPKGPADFMSRWSMAAQRERMREALLSAIDSGLPAYACACSRRELTHQGSAGCAGGCRADGVTWQPGVNALRVEVPAGTLVDAGDSTVDLAATMGDFVIWRRDDQPAYQWASIVADQWLDVDLIVRGDDLRESTAAQLYLAQWIEGSRLHEATFVHHRLLLDSAGGKLSKSAGAQSRPFPRDATTRRAIDAHAAEIVESVHVKSSTKDPKILPQ